MQFYATLVQTLDTHGIRGTRLLELHQCGFVHSYKLCHPFRKATNCGTRLCVPRHVLPPRTCCAMMWWCVVVLLRQTY